MSEHVLRLPIKSGEQFRHATFKSYAYFSKPWLASSDRRKQLKRSRLVYQALNTKAAWYKTVVVIDLNEWTDDEVEALKAELDSYHPWVENQSQRDVLFRLRKKVKAYQKKTLRRLAKVML